MFSDVFFAAYTCDTPGARGIAVMPAFFCCLTCGAVTAECGDLAANALVLYTRMCTPLHCTGIKANSMAATARVVQEHPLHCMLQHAANQFLDLIEA